VRLLEPKEAWFVNASNTSVPDEVIGLLQLGEGFCLPSHNKDRDIVEHIKSIENNFNKLRLRNSNTFRNKLFPLIKSIKNNGTSKMDAEILAAVSITKRFVLNNPNVIFTRADKGNTVVALDRMEYINKMEINLADSNTYTRIQRNPINKITEHLKKTLKRWLQKEYITDHIHARLNSTNAILPRAYGLPKIHKADRPLRTIVSSIGSPLHNLSTYMLKILQKSFSTPDSSFKNSITLVKNLRNVHIPDEFCLVSLDVISLFTNVPIDLVMDSLRKKWGLIESHTKIPKQEFLDTIEFILGSTFFKFNDKIYRQTFGAPMGSPLSPIVADLIMQELESHTLKNLSFIPPFYTRYVDDIALAAPFTQLNDLLNKFNSFHPRLNFTIEVGGSSLNFLEVSMINKNGHLTFDWYHKPTFSGRLLNFHSKHPLTHKIGVITNMVDKILLLSHPAFHEKNFSFLINMLLNNNYPLDIIFSSIKKRLSTKFNQLNNQRDHDVSSEIKENYFVIPYIEHTGEKFIQFFKNIPNFKLTFSGINRLSKFIKVQKDPLPTLFHSNVVYKINCLQCDASYVGQTRRFLKSRIDEHRSHIRRNTSQTSVITEHRVNLLHDFDWENVEVLDEEAHYNKRLISEMIFIKKQSNGLNLHRDTELLDPIYFDIIC